MTVIGIDPGPEKTAITFYRPNAALSLSGDKKPIFEFGIYENAFVFHALYGMQGHIYIEGIQSMGMSVGATVFETAYMIGRIQRFLQAEMRVPYTMIKRTDVKMHHCHSMRAKDTNIRQALVDRFGEPGTKKNPGLLYGCSKDMWSSTAIAVMGYDKIMER